MAHNLGKLFVSLRSEVNDASDTKALEALRVRYLGKKGIVTAELKKLGDMPEDERRAKGKKLNQLRSAIVECIDRRRSFLYAEETRGRFVQDRIDVTSPGRTRHRGSLHPVTLAMRRIRRFFASEGFAEADGPEVEDEYHNFTALNIPENHPARAMHDTFYFGDGRLLRTHTSPVQIRVMKDAEPPVRIIAPGRVYRCDADATHSPMFHQVEGLYVDKEISFADLKGMVTRFLHAFFEDEQLRIRFRPSYFPFTEPSAEVDIFHGEKDGAERWLEVMGCGMVHPNVLKSFGCDATKHSAYAFGLGVERLVMLRHEVADLRQFFVNDAEFLANFEGAS